MINEGRLSVPTSKSLGVDAEEASRLISTLGAILDHVDSPGVKWILQNTRRQLTEAALAGRLLLSPQSRPELAEREAA